MQLSTVSVHLEGCQESFRDGKHCQFLAGWKKKSSILRKGEGGEEEGAVVQGGQ